MKKTLIAAAVALFILAGCNREENPDMPGTASPSGSTGGLSSEPAGTMTPPGAADVPAGNQSAPNTTDDTPTQQQLDPVPPANQSPTPSQ